MAKACFRCLFCGFETCEDIGEVCQKCGHKIGVSSQVDIAKAKIMQILSELNQQEIIEVLRFAREEFFGANNE